MSKRELTAEEAKTLKKTFDAIKPGKTFNFAYIEAGEDGRPLLFVSKRSVATQAKAARQTAKKKKMCRGTVSLMESKKGYRFTTEAPHPKFALHLVRYFGKAIARLKRSEVVVPGEDAQGLGEAAQDAAAAAQQEAEALRARIQKLRGELKGQEDAADKLGAEAKEYRNSFFRTRSSADKKQEQAEEAREAAAAIRDEMAALEAALAAEEEDAVALDDDELASRYDDLDLQSEEDIDKAGHRLQELEREAEACETEESRARAKLARLEESARELQRRMLAKERAAQDAQVRAEMTRGTIFSLRSTARKQQVTADKAREDAEEMRDEVAAFEQELEAARREVAAAAEARQAARAEASDFLDRYTEAERDWWADRNNSEYVAEVLDALEASGDELAAQLEVAQAARDNARAADQALRTAQGEHSEAQAALSRCTLQQRELQDRISAIEAGTIKITGDVVKILHESHEALEALREQEPSLQARLDEISGQLGGLQDRLDSARADAREAEMEANLARMERNEHAMFRNEREHIRELYTEQPQLQADVERLTDEVAALKAEEDASRAAIQLTIDARKRLQDAHTELNLLVLEEQALMEEADKWTFGMTSRKEAVAEAKKKLIDIRVRKAAASEAYDRANQALRVALDDAKDHDMQQTLQAKKARLERERELAERAHQLAEVDSQIAQEEARAATITEDLLTRERDRLLEALAFEDPQLAEARGKLSEAQEQADAVAISLLHQEQRLGTLQEEIESLSARLEDDPSLAAELARKLEVLSKARAAVQKARGAASHASELEDEARAAVDAEVARLCEEYGPLRRLESALAGARAEAAVAEGRDVNADDALLRADDAREGSLRAEQAADAVAAMGDFISQSQGLIDAFHDLKKPDVVETHIFSKDEVVDRNLQRSKTLDLSSPDEIDKLREAVAARSGSEDATLDASYVQLLEFQEQLERHAIEMIKAGATVADLRQAFARVPNGLRPPSYRAEVDAFHTLEEAFAQVEAQKEQTDREKRILEAAESLVSPEERAEQVKQAFVALGGKIEDLESITSHLPNAMEMGGYQSTEGGGWDTARTSALGGDAGMSNPELVVHLDNIFSSFSALTGAVSTVGKFVDYSRDTRETDHLTGEKIEQDPIEKKRQQDKLLDATLSAVSATLQNAKQFGAMNVAGNVPVLGVLGTIDEAKKLAENIVEASVRRGKARYDQLLADSAKVAGSPLASAFEESVARERQLWAKYGLDATANAVTISSHILRGGPPTYAIGVALQIAATTISVGNDIAQGAMDRSKASRAKKLLRDARRGDEAAKTELFKNHAKYAKGLIAHMAFTERDRFALLYVNKRGIDEDMVARSSAKILAYYLLEQAEQTEDPETWEEWQAKWMKRLSTAMKVAKTVLILSNPITAIAYAIQCIAEAMEPKLDPAKLEQLAELEREALEIVDNHRGAADLIVKIDDRIASTPSDAARTALRSKHAALTLLMERYDKFFERVQEGAVAGLRELSSGRATLESLKRAGVDALDRDARKTLAIAEMWLPKLQGSLVSITRNLANAA